VPDSEVEYDSRYLRPAAGMAFPSGVEFIAENGGGAAVRMKKRKNEGLKFLRKQAHSIEARYYEGQPNWKLIATNSTLWVQYYLPGGPHVDQTHAASAGRPTSAGLIRMHSPPGSRIPSIRALDLGLAPMSDVCPCAVGATGWLAAGRGRLWGRTGICGLTGGVGCAAAPFQKEFDPPESP